MGIMLSESMTLAFDVALVQVIDFLVILIYVDENRKYHILRRYNGKHIHKNQIEKNKFRDFHIHKATQRYPEAGFRIDAYAEITDSYNNWKDAFTKMLIGCIVKKQTIQTNLCGLCALCGE